MSWVDRTVAFREKSGHRAETRLSQKVMEKNRAWTMAQTIGVKKKKSANQLCDIRKITRFLWALTFSVIDGLMARP